MDSVCPVQDFFFKLGERYATGVSSSYIAHKVVYWFLDYSTSNGGSHDCIKSNSANKNLARQAQGYINPFFLPTF